MPALTREFCFDVDSQTASNDSALIRVEHATPKNVAGVSGHERPATTTPPLSCTCTRTRRTCIRFCTFVLGACTLAELLTLPH